MSSTATDYRKMPVDQVGQQLYADWQQIRPVLQQNPQTRQLAPDFEACIDAMLTHAGVKDGIRQFQQSGTGSSSSGTGRSS